MKTMLTYELIVFGQTSLQGHALRVLAVALMRLVRPREEESALGLVFSSNKAERSDVDMAAVSGRRGPTQRLLIAPDRSPLNSRPKHLVEPAQQSLARRVLLDTHDRAGIRAKGPPFASQASASAPRLERSLESLVLACSPSGSSAA